MANPGFICLLFNCTHVSSGNSNLNNLITSQNNLEISMFRFFRLFSYDFNFFAVATHILFFVRNDILIIRIYYPA